MDTLIRKPTKEQVRQYFGERTSVHTPPPSQQEIRRRLGWELIEASRPGKYKR